MNSVFQVGFLLLFVAACAATQGRRSHNRHRNQMKLVTNHRDVRQCKFSLSKCKASMKLCNYHPRLARCRRSCNMCGRETKSHTSRKVKISPKGKKDDRQCKDTYPHSTCKATMKLCNLPSHLARCRRSCNKCGHTTQKEHKIRKKKDKEAVRRGNKVKKVPPQTKTEHKVRTSHKAKRGKSKIKTPKTQLKRAKKLKRNEDLVKTSQAEVTTGDTVTSPAEVTTGDTVISPAEVTTGDTVTSPAEVTTEAKVTTSTRKELTRNKELAKTTPPLMSTEAMVTTSSPEKTEPDCKDDKKECPYAANSGYCNKRPLFMKRYCKKSCDLCR